MIRRIFLLAISGTLLLSAAKQCPDHYAPQWFEEASDELGLLIDEYFTDQNISFLPRLSEIKKLGMKRVSTTLYQYPRATQNYNELQFPTHPGLWRYELFDHNITLTHILLKEPEKLSEIRAINTYNDLLGAYWGDYSVSGYRMTLQPEDARIRYQDHYFELNVQIYGLQHDATPLETTYADLLFRDYTAEVNAYIRCKEQQSENTPPRR